jgi:hypothetical protein
MKTGLKPLVFTLGAMSMSAIGLLAQYSEPAAPISHRHCSGVFLKQPIIALNDTGITGEAKLCVDSSGVRSELAARNLVPGYVYSIWFAYIDQPSTCLTPGQCSDPDFYVGHSPVAVFGRTDSGVATRSAGFFSGNVRNLRLSSGSQVWLVAHFHGPASVDDNRELARQLLTAQDPIFGVPEGGALVDMVNGQPKGRPAFIAIFNIP